MEAAPMHRRLALTTITALLALPLALGLVAEPAQAQKKTLVVALNQDPDILDPSPSRTYVGRIIFAQMCEKLYEIDENLRIFPQLAADMPTIGDGGKTVTIKLRPGVKFNDGTPMNAESVRYSLDRHLNMKGSNRGSELESVNSIDVVDPLTVRLRLKTPFSPLVAILADRSGMPVSPTAANKLGDKFGTAPVCVGPWQFVERISQDRIVLERSPHYFDKAAAKFDRLIFRIIPDDNVRLANLRSGDIDVMHLVGPTDAANLRKEGKFEVSSVTGIGYSGLTINLRNKNGKPPAPAGDLGTPLANDPRVREALDLAIDRVALNQVAWDGQYTPGCTPISPVSPFHDKTRKCPARDVAKAKKLLAEAGLPNGYSFEMMIDNDPGKDQAFLIGWSGRVDPDANIFQFHTCGATLNTTQSCDEGVGAILHRAREVSDLAQRTSLYRQAVDKFAFSRRNILYLYHLNYIVSHPKSLKGYKAVPDGLIRIKGVSWQ